MNIRKITSLTALLSFVFLMVTSVILYLVPPGRVAYWADWRLWGLSKTEWGNLHISLGVLFLLSVLLHIYYNWKPIVSYLKNRARQLRIMTPEFNAALILTLLFVLGTYWMVPPFHWIIEFNEYLKDAGSEKYGEPPYGHAELSSLAALCSKTGLDLNQSMEAFKKAGIAIENPQQTILEIAGANGRSPKALFALIKPDRTPAEGVRMPPEPPPGSGRKTLKTLCETYQMDEAAVIRTLREHQIEADSEMTLREIAEKNRTDPGDIYGILFSLSPKQD